VESSADAVFGYGTGRPKPGSGTVGPNSSRSAASGRLRWKRRKNELSADRSDNGIPLVRTDMVPDRRTGSFSREKAERKTFESVESRGRSLAGSRAGWLNSAASTKQRPKR
jgi:hypothetical protein